MTIPILGLKYTIPLVCNTCGVEIEVTFKRGENPKTRRTECPKCGCIGSFGCIPREFLP